MATPATSARSDSASPVHICLITPQGDRVEDPQLQVLFDSRRGSAALVDTPTSVLHTDAFVHRAQEPRQSLQTEIQVTRGDALRERFGGLWGVGRAASHGPALVAMTWTPPGWKEGDPSAAWVGKGIVYDTGGLSIKGKTNMPGMKTDMAGAAAVFGAFRAAVLTRLPCRVVAVLCLAENSVGPDATRPDDVLTMYSGRTVEVNNTDAEGRLVLADGVAWASQQGVDYVVDLATLTGAVSVAVGKQHAGLYTTPSAGSISRWRLDTAAVSWCTPCPSPLNSSGRSSTAWSPT